MFVILHQTTTTSFFDFSKPGFSRLISVDCDACGLLLSTQFGEGDRKDAILHVCLDVFRLSEVGHQHSALQTDDTGRHWEVTYLGTRRERQ